MERIVEILCNSHFFFLMCVGKIAQGKYLRPEYSSVILPAQELNLKSLALESLVNLVKALVQFTEESQQKLDEHNKEENEKDGDDNDSTGGEDTKETTVFEKADE